MDNLWMFLPLKMVHALAIFTRTRTCLSPSDCRRIPSSPSYEIPFITEPLNLARKSGRTCVYLLHSDMNFQLTSEIAGLVWRGNRNWNCRGFASIIPFPYDWPPWSAGSDFVPWKKHILFSDGDPHELLMVNNPLKKNVDWLNSPLSGDWSVKVTVKMIQSHAIPYLPSGK